MLLYAQDEIEYKARYPKKNEDRPDALRAVLKEQNRD